VGHILGLGDRHVANILVDLRTSELIHIDLGVAFEQGRILPTPETIPFRLTRDVVDGFGVSGVEGTFRKGCETTMAALRASKQELMTILEVLMYDPLYNWSMTPEKARRIQREAEGVATQQDTAADSNAVGSDDSQREVAARRNRMAERVLMRVGQKLDGQEDGQLMSVAGQVNTLIQQARDPRRLHAVFPGWQPYL